MHVITGIGRLVRDAELRQAGETQLLSMTIVSDSNNWNKETKSFKPAFIRAVLFGDRATKLEQYLTKGSQLVFSGSFQTNQWETEQGEKRSELSLTLDKIKLVGGSKQESSFGNEKAGDFIPFGRDTNDDDIPL